MGSAWSAHRRLAECAGSPASVPRGACPRSGCWSPCSLAGCSLFADHSGAEPAVHEQRLPLRNHAERYQRSATDERFELGVGRGIQPPAAIQAATSGDILVTLKGAGSTGKACVFDTDVEAIHSREVGVVRVSDSTLNPRFLCAYFQGRFGRLLFDQGTTGSTGQLTLSTTYLKSFPRPAPRPSHPGLHRREGRVGGALSKPFGQAAKSGPGVPGPELGLGQSRPGRTTERGGRPDRAHG